MIVMVSFDIITIFFSFFQDKIFFNSRQDFQDQVRWISSNFQNLKTLVSTFKISSLLSAQDMFSTSIMYFVVFCMFSQKVVICFYSCHFNSSFSGFVCCLSPRIPLCLKSAQYVLCLYKAVVSRLRASAFIRSHILKQIYPLPFNLVVFSFEVFKIVSINFQYIYFKF